MSPVLFSLRVPAALPYRNLAAEAVGRYLEVAGGSAEAAAALVAKVRAIVDSLADAGDAVDVTVVEAPDGIEVRAAGGGRTARCGVPRPVRG
jgi:hypothetical protein